MPPRIAAAAEMPPRFEFSEREHVGYFQLKAPVSQSVSPRSPWSTTCPGESLTPLWSFNSSSWKLCECTSNSRFWVINPSFLTPLQNGRIVNPCTTCPGESSTFLWSFNSLSWKLCEYTSNSLFWMINPLFLTPLGVMYNRQPLHNLSRGDINVPVKFQLFILKTVRMHVEFTFLGD